MTDPFSTKTYDLLNRLTSIVSTTNGSPVTSFSYAYNSANQRTSRADVDSSYWQYQYDSLGQVTSGKKFWNDGTPIAGQQFEYSFDDIGNRTSTRQGGDQWGANLRSANYAVNNLNQYTSRTVPGFANILGSAASNATVTVSSDSGPLAQSYRHSDYFRAELPINNNTGALWLTLTNTAVIHNGTNSDSVSNIVGSIFIPQTAETFLSDADGNLIRDGRWTNTWDGENRQVSMISVTNTPSFSKRRLTFSFDEQGRRIAETIERWDGSQWMLTTSNKFIYSGRDLLLQLNGTNNSVVHEFMFGTDLIGMIDENGGVGGLVAVTDRSQASARTLFSLYDGNANVAAAVDVTSLSPGARFDYGPFGEALTTAGDQASSIPLRFGTQYEDPETRNLYYGYRSYRPQTGRWQNRDPLGLAAGPNLFAIAANDPVNKIDALGLQATSSVPDPKHPGGRCNPAMTCRENIALFLALINAANIRLAVDFGPKLLDLAKQKAPIPPEYIYNPNVTDHRTSWNNHVDALANDLARAAECISIITTQRKSGKCGCCKWLDDKRLRWRTQEVDTLKAKIPDKVNSLSWLWGSSQASAQFLSSEMVDPQNAAAGFAGAGLILSLTPGGQPEAVVLAVEGCLQGL
jgi:RHS repeat-associated protein